MSSLAIISSLAGMDRTLSRQWARRFGSGPSVPTMASELVRGVILSLGAGGRRHPGPAGQERAEPG